jgi:hypothetical protein
MDKLETMIKPITEQKETLFSHQIFQYWVGLAVAQL